MSDKKDEALKLARTALQEVNYDQAYAAEISVIDDALAEQPAQQQKEGFASPGGGYVPAIPRPMPPDWKLVPRKATPEMLKAMDECAQEGYDERLYAGMASSVYMAAWDASPVMGTLPEQPAQQEPVDKKGSPCPEFWDWLPKAYNFEGIGNFTKYNMEVAFLAGKQSVPAQQDMPKIGCVNHDCDKCKAQQQEPVAWADINALTEQFNSVNCGTAYRLPGEGRQPLYTSPPESKPWVGLTDEEWQEIDASLNGKRDLARIFVKAIEAKLKEKNA